MTSPRAQTAALDLAAIAAALRAVPQIAQWQVGEVASARHERYATFLRTESERQARATRWKAWLALPAADGSQGEASFTLGANDGPRELAAQLGQARAAAAVAARPAWTVPAADDEAAARPGADPDALADRAVIADPTAALAGLERAFADAAALAPWTRPSALELFATVEQRSLVNSRGLALRARRTRLYAEFVLLHRPAGGDEGERFDRVEAADLEALALGRRVADAAASLRDVASAVPTPGGLMPAIVRDEALAALIDYYRQHADAEQHARGIAAFALGDAVAAPLAGDALTLTSDPTVPSLAGYAFDEHGYAPCAQPLYADGRLVGRCGSGRWMQKLGLNARGAAGTLVVPPGSLALDTLRRADAGPGVLEVMQFSDLHPRGDTGAFSGEIRLGYLHRPDGTRVAVRGGSLSGVLREAFADVRFAREVATCGGYRGPRAARFARLTVAG